jgi:hypothetical protein
MAGGVWVNDYSEPTVGGEAMIPLSTPLATRRGFAPPTEPDAVTETLATPTERDTVGAETVWRCTRWQRNCRKPGEPILGHTLISFLPVP